MSFSRPIFLFAALLVLAFSASSCKLLMNEDAYTQKQIVGLWRLTGVNDGPPNLHYPESVFEITADGKVRQVAHGKERGGTWRWEENEKAVVFDFDKGSIRAVYILDINPKTLTWRRVRNKEEIHFKRIKGWENLPENLQPPS